MEIKSKIREAIAKGNKNEEAEKLREKFYIAQKKTEEECRDQLWRDSLTPVESLSSGIINRIAYNVAEHFEDMIDGRKVDNVKRIVRRMHELEEETAVEMLRAMFLITGDEKAVKELELIDVCAEFVEEAYYWFIRDMFELELFEWILMEACIEDAVYSHALLFTQC